MTNLRWLKWKITKYYRDQGLQVHLRSIKLGNTAIDGEVIGNGYRIALEIKLFFHNYIRSHEALKGKTPAEVAGIRVEGENKWLTLIQNASVTRSEKRVGHQQQ